MIAFPKLKTRHKSKHISNPKPTATDYCEYDENGEFCGAPYAESHEIYGGQAYRNGSIKYKMQIRLCRKHHDYVQFSPKATKYRKELKQRYQRIFESKYGTQNDFIRIFGKSYL